MKFNRITYVVRGVALTLDCKAAGFIMGTSIIHRKHCNICPWPESFPSKPTDDVNLSKQWLSSTGLQRGKQ